MDRMQALKYWIPHSERDIERMLKTVGVSSMEELVRGAIPDSLHKYLFPELNIPEGVSEWRMIEEARKLAALNISGVPWIGLGYYRSIMPEVIKRTVWENPGWYTQYTPYQAEISQGRMEALLIFQTLVEDLTGLDVANSSLLDEATAAAEAMTMMLRVRNAILRVPVYNNVVIFEPIFPNIRAVLEGRARALGINLIPVSVDTIDKVDWGKVDGVIVQVPDGEGALIPELPDITGEIKSRGVLLTFIVDPMCAVLTGPVALWHADIAVGSLQRFGLPLGYGGPHPGFIATRKEYIRQLPGRLMGVSRDKHGRVAFRMTLQTREQHIRREKATSNICTAQSLPAIVSAFYAVYHGSDGIKEIASSIHHKAVRIANDLIRAGYNVKHSWFFDTVAVYIPDAVVRRKIREEAEKKNHWLRETADSIIIACDECTTEEEIRELLSIFEANAYMVTAGGDPEKPKGIPESLKRRGEPLSHPVFKRYTGELRTLRFIRQLESKDLSMADSMIPLGSCTMKLNASSTLAPVSWKEFTELHPFAPDSSVTGLNRILDELKNLLCEITGMDAFTLMPASGAMGELTGLLIIKAYMADRGEDRDIILIPASAHGTNPASAAQAGFKPLTIRTTSTGEIDVNHLRDVVKEYSSRIAGIMITYPSTHGVFEDTIIEVVELIHDIKGLVYLDGANMNAMLGLLKPGELGVDICHLNLHKTFGIPHGGGGPGAGPVGVKAFLQEYLPQHPLKYDSSGKGIAPVHGSPIGNGIIQIISWMYIRILGKEGLRYAGSMAILNANYLKARLEKYFPVLYTGKNGFVAHEFILDLRFWKRQLNIDAMDIAKRLIDYSIHAPTVSFPVYGTLMIEPTETEPPEELERFIEAMISIRAELDRITEGKFDQNDNPIKNAPHSIHEATGDNWRHAYSRSVACYPLPYLRRYKFWAPVSRIDDAWGDRNPVCRYPEELD